MNPEGKTVQLGLYIVRESRRQDSAAGAIDCSLNQRARQSSWDYRLFVNSEGNPVQSGLQLVRESRRQDNPFGTIDCS